MAQPPAYNRTKDFTVNFSDETDHTALNAEFDDAANSINDIRDNLAILQADDGKLRPAVVTAESIDSAVYDGIIARMAGQDISQHVLSRAEDFADIAEANANIVTEKISEVNTKIAELNAWKNSMLDAMHPVGSLFLSYVNEAPSIGMWTLIGSGSALITAGGSYVAGETYGEDTKTITVDNLPAHTHIATIASAGGHTHTRGSMNITGWFGGGEVESVDGRVFKKDGSVKGNTSTGGSNDYKIAFDASANWTGSTSSNGSHAHTATISSVGGNSPINVMQKSLAVYVFRRTA